ncbi:MAG: hypothetical protein ACR2M7_01070 [Bdellovibrionales bacterium]
MHVLLISSLLLLPFFAQSVVILKTQDHQALIHLEGLRTRSGSYFEALDLYGKPRGLVQIRQVGQKKAIAVLRLGQMKPKWSLEPKSRKWAIYQIRKHQVAFLQKQQKTRRRSGRQIASYDQQRNNQRQTRRRPASSYDNQRNHRQAQRQSASSYEDLRNQRQARRQSTSSYHQQRRPSRSQRQMASSDRNQGETLINDSEFNFHDESEYLSKDASYNPKKKLSKNSLEVMIGLKPSGYLNFMTINPSRNDSISLMGFGFGSQFFMEAMVNKYLSAGAHIGFKRFSAQSQNACGNSDNSCSLKINYIYLGADLKGHLVNQDNMKLSMGLTGDILYPIQYINRAGISNNSFGFHGTLGFNLGADFYIGNFALPIGLDINLVLPPTATTFIGSSGFSMGFGYRF